MLYQGISTGGKFNNPVPYPRFLPGLGDNNKLTCTFQKVLPEGDPSPQASRSQPALPTRVWSQGLSPLPKGMSLI